MARSTSWMPLALGVVLVGAVVGLARFASVRVGEGLQGVAQVIPRPPDLEDPLAGDPAFAVLDPVVGPQDDPGSPDEPQLDLEYPTERDWLFLQGVMRDGTPEARRSAAKALVVMGRMQGVPMLFEAARQPDADADLFCLAALDVLRMQRWDEALPALLQVMLDETAPPSQQCRSEVSDRFAVAGGRDPERLAALAEHEDPLVRGFVAAYLLDVDPSGYGELLARLAQDPDATVRQRAGASGEQVATQSDPPDAE